MYQDVSDRLEEQFKKEDWNEINYKKRLLDYSEYRRVKMVDDDSRK